MKVSEAEILAAMTPAGGWTRETLAGWGVSWPPPKGWKAKLISGAVPANENGMAATPPNHPSGAGAHG